MAAGYAALGCFAEFPSYFAINHVRESTSIEIVVSAVKNPDGSQWQPTDMFIAEMSRVMELAIGKAQEITMPLDWS